jgi:methanogenic corrinoid protein MtbC1
MTVLATAPASGARASGPSLYKLVANLPEERRLRQPADALVIIGRQLELVMQDQGLAADVAIGTLRFSLFRLHQGRIAQLAPHCRSVTVYGEADVEPPAMPGVEFVAVPPGSPLSQEWFVVIDSPFFWGGLITQAVPERASGTMRRYLFDGALTADERVVSRANLLLSLASRRPAPDIGVRYPLANRAHWALVAYHLAAHGEAERLRLAQSLGELPELLEVALLRERPLEELMPAAMGALQRHVGTVGQALYRCEGDTLTPLVWSGAARPPAVARHSGMVGRALAENAPVLAPLTAADPEHALLPGAQSAVAVPLLVNDQPWGVILAGQPEPDPNESPTAAGVIGVAALLEQILAARGPALGAPAYENGAPAAPTAPAYGNGAPAGPMFGDSAPPAPAAPAFGNGAPAAYGSGPTAAFGNGGPVPTPALSSAPPAPAAPAPYGNGAAPAQPVAPPPAAPAYPVPAAPAPAPAGGPSGGAFGLPSWMRGSAPPPGSRSLPPTPGAAPSAFPVGPEGPGDRGFPVLQKRLMGALVAFDQRSAEQVWSEACSVYSTEMVCTELLMPVQIAVGEGWHRGEVSVAAEHFSSRFVEGKLITLLTSYVDNQSGPLAVIGCAQAEMHELGAIMLALFMRWAGFRVIYLGQNIPNSTIEETIRQLRPQIIGLSATTVEAAHNLTEVGQIVARIEPPRPSFIFGGMAFYERPDLRGRIHGQFLEGDVRKIVRDLAAQFKK